MSTIIYCEGALYGPDGRELEHPNYKRATVAVDYNKGFHETVRWGGLSGEIVSFFALLICEKVLFETGPVPQMVPEDGQVLVPLDIQGKGADAPDPILIKLKKEKTDAD